MPKQYKYEKRCNIRQLDGSYKSFKIRADSKKDLEEKCEKRKLEAEQAYQNSKVPYFKTVAENWNEEHEKNIEYNTWAGYQAPLSDLVSAFGNRRIHEITSIEIQSFLNKMRLQGYARQTINLRKITINLIFNYAIMNGLLMYNPATVCKVPPAPKKKIELPSEADIDKVKNGYDSAFGLLPYLIIYTGCRKGEALALRYEDIDFNNNVISINKSIVYINNKAVVKTPKTENGVRTIPLLNPLKNVLPKNKNGYIFTVNGEIFTKSFVNKEFVKYKRRLNVDITFHQLRHVFATFCLDAGLDEKDTQLIMGHSKIETTRNIYTHITESRKKVSAEKLNLFLS